jgi:competence protein ComEC
MLTQILPVPLKVLALYVSLSCVAVLSGIPLLLMKRESLCVFTIYLSVFLLAFGYAQLRNAPTPLPAATAVQAKLRLTSYPRVFGRNLQFRARVVEIEYGPNEVISMRGLRGHVLYTTPFPKGRIQRGDLVWARGIFFSVPVENEGYARYLRSTGIYALYEGFSGDVTVLEEAAAAALSPVHLANRMKRYIEGVNERLMPHPQSAFASAILTGNRDPIPEYLMEVFRRSGTMHILAVSGLHVGFLGMVVLGLLRLIRIPKLYAYLLVGLFIVFFMIFVGERPSVRRASFMALCGITVFIFDRDRNYLNVLALAFIILWLINPVSLFNPGFLLSFCATFGILFITPVLFRRLLRIMPAFAAGALSVSMAVQPFIFPVMAGYFGSYSYINVAANLPIVPLTGFSLALGVLELVLYPVFLPLSVLTAEVNTVVITTIARIAQFFSHAPPLNTASFPVTLIPLYLVLVTVGLNRALNFFFDGGTGEEMDQSPSQSRSVD